MRCCWLVLAAVAVAAAARDNGVSADRDDKDFRFISYQGKVIYAADGAPLKILRLIFAHPVNSYGGGISMKYDDGNDRPQVNCLRRQEFNYLLRAKNRRQKLISGGAERFGSRHSDCLLRLAAARMESGTGIGVARAAVSERIDSALARFGRHAPAAPPRNRPARSIMHDVGRTGSDLYVASLCAR